MQGTSQRLAIAALVLSTAILLAACGGNRSVDVPVSAPMAVAVAAETVAPAPAVAESPAAPSAKPAEGAAARAIAYPAKAELPETIDHDATLGIMGVWSPITATHGNPTMSGFPLSPGLYCTDSVFDTQAFDEDRPFLPMLGESYTIDEATKTVTMKLKPGILWSDGIPITAEDVRASLCMEINRNYVWDFISEVSTSDDRTISVKFLNYNMIILSKVLGIRVTIRTLEYKEHLDRLYDIIANNRMIEPATGRWTINAEGGKKYVKFNGFLGRFKPELTKIPVTGPFVFTAVTNDTIIMGRNENYWNAKEVHFKTLVQHKFTTTENAVLLTKAGKLDMDGAPVTPEVTTQLGRQIPGMRTLLKPVANQYALAFNFEKYPMTIPEVRKAISMAIDRNILFDVKKPLGRPSDPYASGISLLAQEKGTYTDKAFMMTLARYDYDPAKATALLESIGWRKVGGKWTDKNGEPVKLELNSSGIIIEAEICRDLLADFGFEIQYVPVDGNVMWASMEQGKHMIYYGIVASSIFEFPDPWSSFNSVYYYPLGRMASAFAPAKQGDPYVIVDSAGVSHDVGKIIANIRAASTDQELRRLTHEMAKLTNELCPHANLFEEAEVLRIYDPRIRYILKGYDNKAKLVTYDNYSEIRSGFAWSIRVGRMYKVK